MSPRSRLGPRLSMQRWLGRSAARACKMASGARTLNCAAPESTSKLVPGALKGCILRRCAR
eukprot:14822211-Alexandrium_andersonii.AAC.1